MKINVPHIAKLANLKLTEEEITKFEKQLSEVLDYVKKLEEVDTKDVPEASQVTGLENVFRKDDIETSLTQTEALQNAPAKHSSFFQVKGILDSE